MYHSDANVTGWLSVVVTLTVVAAPLIGMAFPALEVLRGAFYLWIPLGICWLLASPVLIVLASRRLIERFKKNRDS